MAILTLKSVPSPTTRQPGGVPAAAWSPATTCDQGHTADQTALHPAAGPQPIVLENVTVGYERHPAVHHLSTVVAPGSLLAVVGPNGAGKSTLLKALVGVLTPMHGRITGVAAPQSRRALPPSAPQSVQPPLQGASRVAYLPQQADIDRSFPISVADMVALGLWHEVGAWGRRTPEQRQRCAQALAAVGLSGFERRHIGTLSGGQFQRMLFARLMLQDAPVVLLDEPFTGVDMRTQDDLLALLHQWHAQGRSVLTVLHDLDLVREHFPHTLLLAREKVAEGATPDVLTPANLRRMRELNEAFDDAAQTCER